MQTAQNEQLGLIGFEGDINLIFQGKEVKNGKGDTVGTTFIVRSRKDIAAAMDLKGKDNKDKLDHVILSHSDEAFRIVKGQIAGLGNDWTLARVTQRTTAAGVRQISVTVKEVKRNTGPSDEAIAKALGWTVEQVVQARTRQTKSLETESVSA